MTNYYVSTTGNNSASGSSSTPWKTINYAMQRDLKPGDTVIVRPGTYNESITIDQGGSAAGDVTLKSEVPGAALIRPPSGAWNAIYVWDNYVTIDGFDIGGATGDGIEANDVHHISILNNKVHGSGESGIQFNWSEFITIEGNETYGNGSSGWFSGISIYQTRNITGDTATQGYRTIVRNNVSHDNMTKSGNHSDGNGIIIDDFQSTQTSGHGNYTFPTLVDANIVYNNGGKGIAVHWTDNVKISNNTAYHNNRDNLNTGTWRGELSNQDSRNNVWVNNIAVANTSVNSNNTAIGFYGSNAGTKWYNNISFNGTAGQASTKLEGGSNTILASDGNKLGVNPLFVNPSAGNFHVQAGSPAINAGSSSHGLQSTDADGKPRVVGIVDIGAYEYASTGGGTTNTAPVARADSGFTTKAGVALTIDDAALLANDTDANGDSLSISAVSGASNGTVKLDASGNAVFTPTAGYTGSAGFSYTAADGKGGTSTASVALTVTSASTTNSPPTITTAAALSVNENVTAVTKVAATDANGDKLTYAITGGADRALFKIDAATGQLSFVTAPNYEAPKDAGANNVYDVSVSVSDGVAAAVSKALAVTVKNVTETGIVSSNFFGSTARPAATETADRTDYELGMKFRATADGEISALRYYRGTADAGDTDARTMNLWSSTGTKLASVNVTSTAGDDGWQVATLAAPIDIDAGKTYTVSYGTTQNYAVSQNYFTTAKTSADGMLVALANGGVFSSGGTGKLPGTVYKASNYWADVVFTPETATATSASASAMAVEQPAVGRTMVGTDGADVLVGTDGRDEILGGGGFDRLDGGAGTDLLRGGVGKDVFVFGTVSDSKAGVGDAIADFVRNHDRIDVSEIDAVSGGSDDAFTWIGNKAFGGHAGELRFLSTGAGLKIQGDVDGDGDADLAFALTSGYHTFYQQDLIL